MPIQDIINRALTQMGRGRAEHDAVMEARLRDVERFVLPITDNFIPSDPGAMVRIGIDPAAPNGDHMAVAVTTTAAEGATATMSVSTVDPEATAPGLTIESLRRARELLERNNTPFDEPMTASEVLRRRGQTGLPNVQIEFGLRYDRNQIQVMTRIPEFRRATMLDPEQLIPDNFPLIAREAAQEFCQHLEREILTALIEASQRENVGRYGQNRMWENIRHMVDLAPGALNYMRPEMMARIMTGDEAPEKTGAFDWLKDFKYKIITHNGWTAKVLDSYEAVKAEGRDMGHCLGGAYTKRIADGEYMAVHITAPEGTKLPKSGFTLGFHRKKKKLTYDQLKGKKNDMSHCQHSGLLWFVRMIEEAYTRDRLPADAVVT